MISTPHILAIDRSKFHSVLCHFDIATRNHVLRNDVTLVLNECGPRFRSRFGANHAAIKVDPSMGKGTVQALAFVVGKLEPQESKRSQPLHRS